jgi:hypothetical protein
MTDKTQNKILLVVRDFLKVHDQLEGKYWPMVDIFAQRLAKGIPEKKISKDFYKAFRIAKGLQPEVEIPTYWYARVGEVRCIAIMGIEWIEKQKTLGTGFWSILELAKLLQAEPKPVPQPKVDKTEDKHFNYFVFERPHLFTALCAIYLEKAKLPDLAQNQRQQKVYERLCIAMLGNLLNDSTFFFDPDHNWPHICQRILGQIKPKQVPAIIDIEAQTQTQDTNT